MMQYLTGGADLTAIALFINRIALGAFFTVSGFHKLFNRQRHAVFVRELVTDRVSRLGFNQWFVPSIEFFGRRAILAWCPRGLKSCPLLDQSGQRWILAQDGLSANDPKRTSGILHGRHLNQFQADTCCPHSRPPPVC